LNLWKEKTLKKDSKLTKKIIKKITKNKWLKSISKINKILKTTG